MVKLICDKCGKDCDRIGFDLMLRLISNFSPCGKNDTSCPRLTDEDVHLRMVLCQDCYIDLGLPNLYAQDESKEVVWPDEKQG